MLRELGNNDVWVMTKMAKIKTKKFAFSLLCTVFIRTG